MWFWEIPGTGRKERSKSKDTREGGKQGKE